jgi:hypothetical protein
VAKNGASAGAPGEKIISADVDITSRGVHEFNEFILRRAAGSIVVSIPGYAVRGICKDLIYENVTQKGAGQRQRVRITDVCICLNEELRNTGAAKIWRDKHVHFVEAG